MKIHSRNQQGGHTHIHTHPINDDEHQSTISMGTIKTTKPVGSVNSECLSVKQQKTFLKKLQTCVDLGKPDVAYYDSCVAPLNVSIPLNVSTPLNVSR